MQTEHLTVYLNDHLAGSTIALELIEHLESTHEKTPLEPFFHKLYLDVMSDREQLTLLMTGLGIHESNTRKAGAWLSERLTTFKLRLDDPGDGFLRLFESLEALSLGIEGKRTLWLTLAATATEAPELASINLARLIKRAEEQRSRVEELRLKVAHRALATG